MSSSPLHLASASGSSLISVLYTLGILVLLAMVVGFAEGRRGGERGLGLGKTCSKAVGITFLVAMATSFVLTIFTGFPADWTTLTTNMILEVVMQSLMLAVLTAAIVSFIPAPIAAFIAYNFGARKRAEGELAKPTHLDHDTR